MALFVVCYSHQEFGPEIKDVQLKISKKNILSDLRKALLKYEKEEKKTLKKSTLEKHIQTYIKKTQGKQQASEELE